jgi:hypothetical protein
MKSCEELLEVERQKYITAETKKGFAEAAILTTWKESVMVADTVEHKLSNAKKLTKDMAESRPRIARKNGSGIGIDESTPTNIETRVREYMKQTQASFREASIFVTGVDPGRGAKQSKAMTESLAKEWRAFAPFLNEQEIQQLAERGIEP